MKTLLLTDIPPCNNYTAGLVTAQMCRALLPGELAAFVIMNGELKPKPEPDLAWIPTRFVAKPDERGRTRLGPFAAGELAAFAHETASRLSWTRHLIKEAVQFGLAQEVDQVWAILQGQTMVRVSRRVARALGVPLKTQIWDPISWWHRAWGVDRVNRTLDDRELVRTLRASATVASASPAMSREITARYGTDSFPVIASVDRAASHEPAKGFRNVDELVIGLAGQFYALEGWQSLCDALDANGWRVEGRRVRLLVLGASPPPNAIAPEHIRHLGWLEQPDAIAILARDCDLLYCPYPFSPEMEEVSRLSFPSKVVIYLAAGRPILFHGPAYSSPYAYLADKGAALLCSSLDLAAVYGELRRLTSEPDLYGALARAGRDAFLRDFTTDRQRQLVHRFLGVRRDEEAAQPRSGRAGARRRGRRRSRLDHRSAMLESKFDEWRYLRDVPLGRPGEGPIEHYQRSGWREDRDPNAWFSTRFYLHDKPSLAQAGVEPLGHYLAEGWRRGFDPNPWFSTRFYLAANPDVAARGAEPLCHYLTSGWREGRRPHPLFSTRWYLERYPDIASAGCEPLCQHFDVGWREGRDPSDWFSTRWYLEAHPDVGAAGVEPWGHYVVHGWREGRDPNAWFSVRFYLERYRDVAEADVEPATHYLTVGWREGRDPNPWFSTAWYVQRSPHLLEEGTEPCSHYLRRGWREGLSPNETFSVPFYLATNPDVAASGEEPLGHYLAGGWREGRDPHPEFSVRHYLRTYPDVAESGLEPTEHWRRIGRAQGRRTRPDEVEARRERNGRRMALAERLIASIVQEIEDEIDWMGIGRRSERGPYFDLLDGTNRAIQDWLTSELE